MNPLNLLLIITTQILCSLMPETYQIQISEVINSKDYPVIVDLPGLLFGGKLRSAFLNTSRGEVTLVTAECYSSQFVIQSKMSLELYRSEVARIKASEKHLRDNSCMYNSANGTLSVSDPYCKNVVSCLVLRATLLPATVTGDVLVTGFTITMLIKLLFYCAGAVLVVLCLKLM